MVKVIKMVITFTPGRSFSLSANAASEVTMRVRSVPITTLSIVYLYAFIMLPSLNTCLKFSSVNALGKKYTPPFAASAPSFNERASTFMQGKIITRQSASITSIIKPCIILSPKLCFILFFFGVIILSVASITIPAPFNYNLIELN